MNKFKIVLVGDEAVGKTALIHKYINMKEVIIDYRPTLGVEITKTNTDIINDYKSFDLYFWDIAGQEMFVDSRPIYYEGADGALIIFDSTRIRTFKHVLYWYEEVMRYSFKKIPILLVANKKDLKDLIKISNEEIEKLAEKLNINYIETSALTGLNVIEMVKKIIDLIKSN
ncbi:MAG: Rab family GTPase [Candidatus Helarchaeota archaeon]